MGGREKDNGKCTSKMLKYDPGDDRWIQLSSMKKSKTYFSIMVVEKRILITGKNNYISPEWKSELS